MCCQVWGSPAAVTAWSRAPWRSAWSRPGCWPESSACPGTTSTWAWTPSGARGCRGRSGRSAMWRRSSSISCPHSTGLRLAHSHLWIFEYSQFCLMLVSFYLPRWNISWNEINWHLTTSHCQDDISWGFEESMTDISAKRVRLTMLELSHLSLCRTSLLNFPSQILRRVSCYCNKKRGRPVAVSNGF